MADPIADLKSIFGKALELPTSRERSAYLDQACQGDARLRGEVESLLRAHPEAGGFFGEHSPAGLATVELPCAEPVGAQIGPYKIRELLGEGGMGRVYAAEQEKPLRRKVALKIIRPGMDTRQVIARFDAERQVLALMDHPHIARVLDAGATDDGRPYFVMELVRGVPITEFCDSRHYTTNQRLALFIKVCQAVQHAHQKGIIHRDLKPSNVLVTMHDDLAVPKVIDFGVAKATSNLFTEHSVYTGVAQLIGTPLYMSPEQAEMNALDVDTRSDVYSLGVLLYELLTGETPFKGEALKSAGYDEMRRMIREVDPPRPSTRVSTLHANARSTICEKRHTDPQRLSRQLRGELDWIVMKALEKGRDRRYSTAHELAEDVARYLNDMPVVARRSPWRLRLRKWRRRHPIQTLLLLAALLFFAALGLGAYWHQRQLAYSLAVVERLRREGLERENALRREMFTNDLQQASLLRGAGKNAEAVRILARRKREAQKDSRGIAWAHLWKISQPEPARVLRGHSADILSADVSPDQKFIASSDRGGGVKIWDPATGEEVRSLQYGDKEVTCVRFSPDGVYLATAGQDKTIRLWSVETWTELHKLEKHEATVTAIAWSPDGKRLASSGRDHFVHIWDCLTGSVERTLPEHADVVRCIAWSPDGNWLVTPAFNSGLAVWETVKWRKHGALKFNDRAENPLGVLAVAFSPDSQLIAYGGYGRDVVIAETVKLNRVAGAETGQVWSLAFVSAGVLAVGGNGNGGLLSFDRQRGAAWIGKKIGEAGALRAFMPTPGRTTIIAACEEGRTISIWQVDEVLGFNLKRIGELPVALAPHASLIASVPKDALLLNLRREGEEAPLASFEYQRSTGCLAVFSPRGDLLAAPLPRKAQPVVLWNTKTSTSKRLKNPGFEIKKLAFSHDGKWLAAAGKHCIVGVWDTQNGEWREVLPPDPALPGETWQTAIAFSPTENLLAATRWDDKRITLWRPEGGMVSQQLPARTTHALAFSPDGKTLAAETENAIALWNVATAQSVGNLPFVNEAEQRNVEVVSFSPDNATLASAATDGALFIWDLKSRRQLVSAKLPGWPISLQYRSNRHLVVGCRPDVVVHFEMAIGR